MIKVVAIVIAVVAVGFGYHKLTQPSAQQTAVSGLKQELQDHETQFAALTCTASPDRVTGLPKTQLFQCAWYSPTAGPRVKRCVGVGGIPVAGASIVLFGENCGSAVDGATTDTPGAASSSSGKPAGHLTAAQMNGLIRRTQPVGAAIEQFDQTQLNCVSATSASGYSVSCLNRTREHLQHLVQQARQEGQRLARPLPTGPCKSALQVLSGPKGPWARADVALARTQQENSRSITVANDTWDALDDADTGMDWAMVGIRTACINTTS